MCERMSVCVLFMCTLFLRIYINALDARKIHYNSVTVENIIFNFIVYVCEALGYFIRYISPLVVHA